MVCDENNKTGSGHSRAFVGKGKQAGHTVQCLSATVKAFYSICKAVGSLQWSIKIAHLEDQSGNSMQTGLACGQPLSGEDTEESFKKKSCNNNCDAEGVADKMRSSKIQEKINRVEK